MPRITQFFALLPLVLLTACVHIPTGPSVMVLPASNKNFDQFRADDALCRQFAHEQVGGQTARQASLSSGMESAAIGAALGAIAGAAFGGGRGAAIGAGGGLLAGGLSGSGAARSSGYIGQQRYDAAYMQCMYANGHQIPSPGRFANERYPSSGNYNRNVPPRAPSGRFQPPPPPPGYPPPPPPY
ncbi:YMGG-like glycine zipper-containing protein [Nitrosomonas sp.]|uniref:YMGG-like glycine zipper-containing protein n=1 Tax=Nitrosomonas sp. TaxID=42353 RepID=UPI0026230247|nr:YMGG-like glycine zipper-containing protein [Nitrosomonas sp.]MCW5602350.1 hypothetical protein [Nitrosomonas sp.]